MSLEYLKKKSDEFRKKGDAFFNYAEKAPSFNSKKALNFGKPKKVKKSFNSSGMRF